MSMIFKAHYDGINLIPDEPVDLPVNVPLELEFKQPAEEPEWDPEKARRALTRVLSRAVDANIPLEALRRENMYEDRGV